MAELMPAVASTRPLEAREGSPALRYSLAWLSGALPAFAVIAALWLFPNDFQGIGEISLGAFALMFPVAVRQLNVPRKTGFVYFLLGAGIVFSIGSILTGAANGLTNEPFTTPRYVGLLFAHHDPYVVPLVFNYVQYGQTLNSQSLYLWGPLLMFFQLPGIDYKWFAVGCWGVMVLLVRKRFDVAVMLAQPYVAILAASGYNDLVVLVFMTLAFVGYEGRRQKWAEWLSLGMKQFANLFILAYHLIRRDWRNALGTLVVTGAFVAPFFLWSGSAVLCPAIFGGWFPTCHDGAGTGFQLNYSLWVIWGVAVFYAPFVAALRQRLGLGVWARWLERTGLTPDALLRLPAFLVVGVSGVFVNLCVFTLLGLHFGGSTGVTLLASTAAFGVATLWNFAWNRTWAFQGRSDRSTAFHLAAYGAIQLAALGVNLAVLDAGVSLGIGRLESQLVGILLGSVLGYVANLRWNFRASSTAPA